MVVKKKARVKYKSVQLRYGTVSWISLARGRADLVEKVDPDLAALMRKEW